MASRPRQVVGEKCAVGPLIGGLPTEERREWLTRLLEATEKALTDLGESHERGPMIEDLGALRDRLEAELAIPRGDEWAGRLFPRTR